MNGNYELWLWQSEIIVLLPPLPPPSSSLLWTCFGLQNWFVSFWTCKAFFHKSNYRNQIRKTLKLAHFTSWKAKMLPKNMGFWKTKDSSYCFPFLCVHLWSGQTHTHKIFFYKARVHPLMYQWWANVWNEMKCMHTQILEHLFCSEMSVFLQKCGGFW